MKKTLLFCLLDLKLIFYYLFVKTTMIVFEDLIDHERRIGLWYGPLVNVLYTREPIMLLLQCNTILL